MRHVCSASCGLFLALGIGARFPPLSRLSPRQALVVKSPLGIECEQPAQRSERQDAENVIGDVEVLSRNSANVRSDPNFSDLGSAEVVQFHFIRSIIRDRDKR